MARARAHTARRIAICRYPGTLEVRGSVRSFCLTAGAEVDLDEVVGVRGTGPAATPETLEASLGEYVRFFDLPSAPPGAAVATVAAGDVDE